ncbi:unnamed protein product [Rotaria magnacalcarata]
MSDERNDEVEMVMDQKSRFSRYRMRVREKINLEINETMFVDDQNTTSMTEVSNVVQRHVELIAEVPIIKYDACTQTSDYFLNFEAEQIINEYNENNDINRFEGITNIFLFYNDYISKSKDNDNDSYELGDNDHDANQISIDMDDDMEDIPDVECNVFDNNFKTERPPNAIELSVMLLLLWKKHSISKAAVNDICRILNFFNIPNMPKDFRGVISRVKKNNSKLLHGNHSFICPSCLRKGSSSSKCDANGCVSALSYARKPTSVFTFSLLPQIISILEREDRVSSSYVFGQSHDVINSRRYQEIITKQKQIDPQRNIVTFTLNTDGVLIKRISRSLWMTCACINELPRSKRFQINNILICSISTGDEKPKKKEYAKILEDIVHELKFLENIVFDVILPSHKKDHKNKYTHFYAFTISAVCDKPAQALAMNIKDPTGYFSLSETSTTGTRCFITKKNTSVMVRNNATYDAFIQILDSNYVEKDPMKDKACGHLGHCALRNLTYFEIGESFCFDSLHGLYTGVFVRSLVKSIYGPSMVISELINNFELSNYATTILKNHYFHPKVALLINQILSSKRRAVPKSIEQNIVIHLARTTPIAFSHVAIYIDKIYGKGQYTYHSLCFCEDVPLKVHRPSNSQVDDSALIYVDDSNNIRLGVIVGIIRLITTTNIIFIIDQAKIMDCDFFLLNGIKYINDLLVYTQFPTPPNTISIGYNSIIEKAAYRFDQHQNSICEFHLFPNLLEST